jgi:DNA-binding CsgD family transcriptional regulator
MHLTTREKQALDLTSQGSKRELVAEKMNCSVWTVDFHLQNVRRKLAVHTTLEAVVFFVRQPADFRSYPVQELMRF